jgi:NADH-quinone oxidoreductase subunit J
VLYTDYLYAFQISGLILLVAMIGAIVLTLRHRKGVRKQRIARQVSRRREDAVVLVSLKPGEGA